MAESTLALSYPLLRREIGYAAGYTRNEGAWSADEVADIESVIQSGVRQFFYPPPPFHGYQWNFFKPVTTLTTSEPYSTGTVAATNGVVTLTTGTFPTWAASGVFVYQSVAYEISTRDSGTQITLVNTTLDITAGAAYEVNQQDYDLEDDFGFIAGEMTYSSEETVPGITRVSDSKIREMRQRTVMTGRPEFFSIRPKAATLTTGQRFEVMFYPTPDDDYTLVYPYQPIPGKLTATNLYTYGGAAHAETLLESCLAIMESRLNDTQGVHAKLFLDRMASSVELDKRLSPRVLGYNGDQRYAPESRPRPPRSGYATYEGNYYLG